MLTYDQLCDQPFKVSWNAVTARVVLTTIRGEHLQGILH